jgi:hypothetical protein
MAAPLLNPVPETVSAKKRIPGFRSFIPTASGMIRTDDFIRLPILRLFLSLIHAAGTWLLIVDFILIKIIR